QRTTSPLEVRVPATMQNPNPQGGGNQSGNQNSGNSATPERQVPPATNGAQPETDASTAPKAKLGLLLVTNSDTPNGPARAVDMKRFLDDQGIDNVELVQDRSDGMLSVFVLLPDRASEASLRARLQALPTPRFDKKFEFAKQTLPLKKYY